MIPEDYDVFVKGTGECPAKFSELANAADSEVVIIDLAFWKATVWMLLKKRLEKSMPGVMPSLDLNSYRCGHGCEGFKFGCACAGRRSACAAQAEVVVSKSGVLN